MPEINNSKPTDSKELYLNTAIGFLSVLLLLLLAALFTRIIYPRIFNERAELQSELISEIIQIEVLNGCGVSGIANAYTGLLRSNGFDVVETGNFETFDLQETVIISRSGVIDNAYRVASALGVSEDNVIQESSPDFYLDVSVIIGHDYEKLNTD
ncbi:LytR C-terminal domain-containing protein [Gracilimonas halophila]|uniref:LytR C-terminal domain-containing protein n=1 Tax=Gracilimonas halophila TaxID=1834464 RepID=A0ABW5JHB5_9BACT